MVDPRANESAAIRELLDFWFEDCRNDPAAAEKMNRRWFGSDEERDREIEKRFGDWVEAAARGDLDSWRRTAAGKLALVLLLDQLARNAFRGSARAFAHDERALEIAKQLIDEGLEELSPPEKIFALMPYTHSEDLENQKAGCVLLEQCLADAGETWKPFVAEARDYAQEHRKVIARFGRFPHRNRLLGRESTEDEEQYLSDGGESWGQ